MKYIITLVIFFCSILFLRSQTLAPVQSGLDTMSASHSIDDSIRLQMEEQKELLASQMAKADLTYFVMRVPDQQYGYSIFIDGNLYIEQKSIPAISGNAGFATTKDAEKVAKLVIEKIRIGEMPPTISIEELKELKVIAF